MGRYLILTSIPPRFSRLINGRCVGSEYQRQCAESWRAAGFEIVSINSEAEVDAVRALDLPIEIMEGSAERPRLWEILRVANEAGTDLCAIVNADCKFIEYGNIANKLKPFCESTLMVSERIDVEGEAYAPVPGNCAGFDAFFFDPRIARGITQTDFSLGDPWWDYWFPCALAARGFGVQRIATPLVLHLAHKARWNQQDWEDGGNSFREQLIRQLHLPTCTEEFRNGFATAPVATMELPKLGELVHGWLWSQDSTVDVRFLPLDTPEQLLRRLRDYHSVDSVRQIANLELALSVWQQEASTLDVALKKFDMSPGQHLKNILRRPFDILRHKTFLSTIFILVLIIAITMGIATARLLNDPLVAIISCGSVLLIAASAVLYSYLESLIQPFRDVRAIARDLRLKAVKAKQATKQL